MVRSGPSRQRLRSVHRILSILAWISFALTAAITLRVALRGGSPFLAAAALYAGTVAYGLGAMARLRERVLFGPGADAATGTPASRFRWWFLRLLLVLLVAALPAVLLLGGLQGR